MTKLVQTTDDYKADKLELHYYFDASVKESKREFYNDDGITANAFEKGKYEILEFESELTKRCLEIGFESEFGKEWSSSEKEIKLIIHNINWNPNKVKVDGKRIRISSEKNRLTIPVKWNPTKELKVKITLK
jgi:hypothetical protein